MMHLGMACSVDCSWCSRVALQRGVETGTCMCVVFNRQRNVAKSTPQLFFTEKHASGCIVGRGIMLQRQTPSVDCRSNANLACCVSLTNLMPHRFWALRVFRNMRKLCAQLVRTCLSLPPDTQPDLTRRFVAPSVSNAFPLCRTASCDRADSCASWQRLLSSTARAFSPQGVDQSWNFH